MSQGCLRDVPGGAGPAGGAPGQQLQHRGWAGQGSPGSCLEGSGWRAQSWALACPGGNPPVPGTAREIPHGSGPGAELPQCPGEGKAQPLIPLFLQAVIPLPLLQESLHSHFCPPFAPSLQEELLHGVVPAAAAAPHSQPLCCRRGLLLLLCLHFPDSS